MHKKIVSTCSPNNDMYWVCIQYIIKKFPDGLLLVTPYIPIREHGGGNIRLNVFPFLLYYSICFAFSTYLIFQSDHNPGLFFSSVIS